jgi:hypothetical protein
MGHSETLQGKGQPVKLCTLHLIYSTCWEDGFYCFSDCVITCKLLVCFSDADYRLPKCRVNHCTLHTCQSFSLSDFFKPSLSIRLNFIALLIVYSHPLLLIVCAVNHAGPHCNVPSHLSLKRLGHPCGQRWVTLCLAHFSQGNRLGNSWYGQGWVTLVLVRATG